MKRAATALAVLLVSLSVDAALPRVTLRPASVQTGPGIVSADFPTNLGDVYANLPGDLAAGEAFSGTLAAIPAGGSNAERERNAAALRSVRVSVCGSPVDVGSGSFFCSSVPAGTMEIVARAPDGGESRARVTVAPRGAAAPRAFSLPAAGIAGQRVHVAGPFAGDLSRTRVRIGGKEARVVAESPRGCLVDVPPDVPGGAGEIEVAEGKETRRGPFRCIGLRLTSPQTTIHRGASTTFTAEVYGLSGLDSPLSLTLTNLTPAIVAMEKGEKQIVTIAPGEVSSSGTFAISRRLTGLVRGDYVINAYLPWSERIEEGGHTVDGGGKPPVSVAPPGTAIAVRNDDDQLDCHCAAGRLIVVIGNDRPISAETLKNDEELREKIQAKIDDPKTPAWQKPYVTYQNPTIAAARAWALNLANSGTVPHLHVLSYFLAKGSSSIGLDSPETVENGAWVKAKTSELYAGKWKDCCFYQEAIFLFHGAQFPWPDFVEKLPSMLGGKAVRKLTIWSCESTDQFFPNSGKGLKDVYENVAAIVAPKHCPCECDPTLATHKGPDGHPLACPTGKEPTTILASAGFMGRAVKLSLGDPSNPRTALSSPSGTMREITVDPSGAITAAETGASPEVFGGITVGANGQKPDPNAEKYDPKKFEAPSRTKPPKKGPKVSPYKGPKACPSRNGCLPDAT